jgi:hypothetical protein
MAVNFNQPVESQTVAARNTSDRDNQISMAKLLEGEGITGPVTGIKRLNSGLFEEWNGSGWVEKSLNYAKTASPTFTGTPAAPTAAVDTNTTQLATTAFVVAQSGAANPLMNGSVAVGTSLRYSRQDHVHASDTSRAPTASPTFTGTPLAPTAAVDTNTTQIATTAFVIGQAYAKLASPTFTGTPLAPTAAVDTNTTQIATTAFVIGQAYAKLASPALTGTPTHGGIEIGYRRLPAASVTTGAFVAADSGKCVKATGGVTVPNSTMAADDVVTIYNNTASSITITASITTLRFGAAGSGNRTLAARGLCTLYFIGATEAVIQGSGLT